MIRTRVEQAGNGTWCIMIYQEGKPLHDYQICFQSPAEVTEFTERLRQQWKHAWKTEQQEKTV